MLAALLPILAGLLDKLIPDPAARDRAKAELLKAENGAEMEKITAQLSAIVAESRSADPWTSRARPTFLYVMYVMILASIPMGALWAFEPAIADRVALGLQKWLAAIPQEVWWLFGTGYLGYTGARTWEKGKGVGK